MDFPLGKSDQNHRQTAKFSLFQSPNFKWHLAMCCLVHLQLAIVHTKQCENHPMQSVGVQIFPPFSISKKETHVLIGGIIPNILKHIKHVGKPPTSGRPQLIFEQKLSPRLSQNQTSTIQRLLPQRLSQLLRRDAGRQLPQVLAQPRPGANADGAMDRGKLHL